MFKDIIGNETVKKNLEQLIKNNNIAHSYMFVGKDSIGKLLFAKEFAKAILCEKGEGPCNRCKSCIEFESSNNPDFLVIKPDGNSIKIDQIRELVKNVYEKPIVSEKKVYIIDQSETMTQEAQNSLLKTLEEPPEYITIILISSNENLFLPTIKSRCTKIVFNALTDDELKEVLNKQNIDVSEFILNIAEGSVKKALKVKDKEQEYMKIKEVYSNLESINIIDLINSKEDIFKEKEDVFEILEYINIIFFDKIKKDPKYIDAIKEVEETKDRIKKNCNYDMSIDNFNMKVWEEING